MAQQVTNLLNNIPQNKTEEQPQQPKKEAAPANNSQPQPNTQSPQYNEKEMEALRAQVVKKKTLEVVPKDKFEPFTQYLIVYKQKMLDEERYLDARDTANLIDKCKDVIENLSPVPPLQAMQANTTVRNNAKITKLEQDIADYDEQTKAKISAVQKRQAELLENFENDWRTRMPEQYRRPSKRLLELKTSAHELGASGHYEEAQLKHDEAVELEAAERLEAQRKLNRDYRFAKERILTQYKQELENLIESRRLKKELMETQKRQLEISEQKRETVLRAKFQNPPKKSMAKGQSSAMQTARSVAPTRKSLQANEIKLPPLVPPNPLPQKPKPNQSVPSTKPSSRNESEVEDDNDNNNNNIENNANDNDNNNNANSTNDDNEPENTGNLAANIVNNTNLVNALSNSLGQNQDNNENNEDNNNNQEEGEAENNANDENNNNEVEEQTKQGLINASGLLANALGQKPSEE